MTSRSEHIYRDGWPKGSSEWSVYLVEEMGLEWGFWTYKKLDRRREKLAVVLLCLRLKLRHNYSITEIANLFGKARTGIYPYVIRGVALLRVDRELCRVVTQLDGQLAPSYLLAMYPDLWETLFDEKEPDQLAALN